MASQTIYVRVDRVWRETSFDQESNGDVVVVESCKVEYSLTRTCSVDDRIVVEEDENDKDTLG